MTDFWYYAEGNESRGPVTFDRLIEILSQVRDAREILLWRDGFEDWKPTHEVPEIGRLVLRPPPLRPKVPVPLGSKQEPVINSSDTAEYKDEKPTFSRTALKVIAFVMVTVFFGFLGKDFFSPVAIEGYKWMKRQVIYQLDRPVTSDFEYEIAFALRLMMVEAKCGVVGYDLDERRFLLASTKLGFDKPPSTLAKHIEAIAKHISEVIPADPGSAGVSCFKMYQHLNAAVPGSVLKTR
jgi:hypothetical protein